MAPKKVKHFQMIMSDSMHKRLRVRAAINGVTVKKLVLHIIELHFGLQNKNHVGDEKYVETDE